MNTLPTCPEDVMRRGAILNSNGFGFQEPGGVRDRFTIAKLSKELSSDQLRQVTEMTNATTVRNEDYLGYDFLSIHWTEYSRHADVLTSLLTLGVSFTTHNHLSAHFDASKDHIYIPKQRQKKKRLSGLMILQPKCLFIKSLH